MANAVACSKTFAYRIRNLQWQRLIFDRRYGWVLTAHGGM